MNYRHLKFNHKELSIIFIINFENHLNEFTLHLFDTFDLENQKIVYLCSLYKGLALRQVIASFFLAAETRFFIAWVEDLAVA